MGVLHQQDADFEQLLFDHIDFASYMLVSICVTA